MAGVWNDVLQKPVERSQIFTTPSESLEIAEPLFACREMDLTGAETGGVDLKPVATGSVKALICQNLTELSLDAEIRVEERAIEVM